MSALSEELDKVRNNIAQYQGQELGEANTKTALIDPVLRALGWQVGNLTEVRQEYKHTPNDNPVDYALLVSTPKLFVEAKALGHNLEDHKWAAQTVNYGNNAGVKWVVLTDGTSTVFTMLA
jgi:predicted type IV restriction endonuclease